MTYEQLRCFTMAAREKTFFDAAETLHITQSSLSKQIMKLETELGVHLFDRSRRSATLTDAGVYFCPKAEMLCREYEAALADFKQYLETSAQEIRLGALPILTSFRLNERLLKFTKEHPEIKLTQEEAEEEALLDGLKTGRYDFIIAREALVANKNDFSYRLLATDELCAVLSRTHPLYLSTQNNVTSTNNMVSFTNIKHHPFAAGSVNRQDSLSSNTDRSLSAGNITPVVSRNDLSSESLLLMREYTSVYHECKAMFARMGINPRILRTARLETVIGSAAVGEGIGLIPKSSMKTFHHPDAVVLSIVPAVPLNIVLAKKKRQKTSPSMKLFFHALTDDFTPGETDI